jgi:RNA polymerase sigma factor (sigma-70 family)
VRAIADDLHPVVARVGPRTDHDILRTSLHRPEVFARIFDRHAPAIHRYLGRRVGDHADDLLSETFLTAFRKRAAYQPTRIDVRPWLYGIAANLVRRHQRAELARYRMLARSAEAESANGTPDELDAAVGRVDAQLVSGRLAAALADLHARDREVLLLVAWGDLTYAEVSAALAIPVGTVRSRLNRARRLVQGRLALSPDDHAGSSTGPRSPHHLTLQLPADTTLEPR